MGKRSRRRAGPKRSSGEKESGHIRRIGSSRFLIPDSHTKEQRGEAAEGET